MMFTLPKKATSGPNLSKRIGQEECLKTSQARFLRRPGLALASQPGFNPLFRSTIYTA